MLKKIFSCAAFVCLLCACSGIPTEREVTVSDVDITGFIKSYVKVVDGTYKFTNNGKEASITVQFELIKKADSDICHKKYPEDIRLNAIGEGGTVFDTGTYGFETNRTEISKFKDLINNGNIGDRKFISFTWQYFRQSEDIGSVIFNDATTFELIDATFNYCNEITDDDLHWDDMNRNTKQNSTKSNKETTNSTDWDKALDDYEAYVDSYIKLLKKAQAGDMSAMTEYPTCLEKAEAFGKKFDNANGSMSTKQIKRYTDITMKITTAAMP